MPDPTPIGPPAVGGSGWITPQNPTPIGPPSNGGSGAVTPQNPTPIGPPSNGGSGATASTSTTAVGPARIESGWVSAPRITSITPDETSTAGGATITIEGTNLDGATSVTVDGSSVSFTQVDPSTITFAAPAHAIGTVDVTVTTPSGSDTAPLTYYAPLTVSTLDPATGPTLGGTLVTITGSGFTGVASVTFDGIPGTSLAFVDDTTITVRTPVHAAGVVDVVVANAREDTSGDPATFTYFVAAPQITSVTPDEAPTVGGAAITIEGVALGGVTSITLGGASISFTQVSTTEVSFTAPPHALGEVPIVLTTPYGSDSATLTYYNACRVTDVSPPAGSTAGGTVVTLTGSGFTDASAVDFGGAAGTIIAVVSDFELRVRTPAHAAGAVHVRVTNPRETSPVNGTDDQFTYVTAPTISSMTPTSGPTSGGTPVTLTGTSLDTVETLLVGTADVPFTIVNPTTITFTTPPQPAGDAEVIALDANDAGASPPTAFTFYAAATVTAVVPSVGGTAGGTPVRITGTGFLGATAVAFGATPATSFVVSSDTQILAVAPAHALGVVHVRVTNPRETSPINGPNDEFSYIPPPTITSIDPTEGTVAGGTVVTVTGTNFVTGATTVTFDGVNGSAVTVTDPTTLTVVTPVTDTPGPVDVVVTTPAGVSTPATFTYTNLAPIASANAAPTIGQAVLTVAFSPLGSYDPDGNELRRFHWDFGDGTDTLAVSPIHTYSRPGTYTVTLTVTDTAGVEASDTVEIVVLARAGNSAPVARATADPVHGDAALLVRFDGSASFDPDGTIYSYEWDFGDGTTGNVAALNHIYERHGTYVATLRVTDNDGEVGLAPPILITVDEPIEMLPPEIALLDPRDGSAAGGTPIHVNGANLLGVTSVKFCKPGEDDGPEAESFIVLDDNTMLVVSPPAADSMLVNVRASNRDYTSVPGPNSLFTYRRPPVAVITPELSVGDAPLLAGFSSEGSYSPIGPITYFWTFNGSPLDLGTYQTSYEANPAHLFQYPGTYAVTLTVTDRRGITAKARAVVIVTSPAGGDPGSGGSTPPWGGGGNNGGEEPGGGAGGGENPGGDGVAVSYDCDVDSKHIRRSTLYDPDNTGVSLFTEEWSARRLGSGVLFTVTVTVLTDFLLNAEKPLQHPARVFFGAIAMTGDGGHTATTASKALVLNPRIISASNMTLVADYRGGLFTPLINGGLIGIEAGSSFTISGLAPAKYDIAYAQVGFLNAGGGTVGDTSSAWIAVECDIEEARRINGWTVATDPAMGGTGWTLGQHATVEPPKRRRKRR